MKLRTDDELNSTIHQEDLHDKTIKPLTYRAILNHITKLQRADALRSDTERHLLADFAADPVGFIDEFLETAMQCGETLREKSHKLPDGKDGGFSAIHRFLGLYVCSVAQYGEGRHLYGPYRTKKEANASFRRITVVHTPL